MIRYQLLPPLSQEEYEALKADIAERGVLVPVEYDEDGNILDGHHRVKACQELGIKEWPSIVRIGLSEDEKVEHVLKLNIHRRHLPKEWKQEKARELREQGWSYRRIAAVLGIHHDTAREWAGVGIPTPENKNAITGADGKQYPAVKPRPTQKPYVVLDKPKDIERVVKAVDAAEEVIPAKRIELERLEKIAREANIDLQREKAKSLPPPTGKYRVIYADPPWQYSNSGFVTSAESQYPTMPTEEICNLPIKDLADENAVLFLWATNPLLEDALRVCKAWGFSYKTNFAWIKNQHTGGFYCYGQHELLFVASRGSMLPKPGSLRSSVIEVPRREHSRKPDEVYAIIEAMYDGPYIELFARSKREGWAGWGVDYGVFSAAG